MKNKKQVLKAAPIKLVKGQRFVMLRHIVVKKDGTFEITDGKYVNIDVGQNKLALNMWRYMAKFVDEKGKNIVPSKDVLKKLEDQYEITYIHTGHRGTEARVLLKKFNKVERYLKGLPVEKKIARRKLFLRRKIDDFRSYGIDKIRIINVPKEYEKYVDGVIFYKGKEIMKGDKNRRNLEGAEVKGFAKGSLMNVNKSKFFKKLIGDVQEDELVIPSCNVKMRKDLKYTIDDIWIAEYAKTRAVVKDELEYGIAAMIKNVKPIDVPEWTLERIYELVKLTDNDNMASALLKAGVPLNDQYFVQSAEPIISAEISRIFRIGYGLTGFAVALPKAGKVDEIVVGKRIAKWLNIKKGGTVVLTRNPIPGILGLLRVKVKKIVDKDVIYVHPDIWTGVLKGDYDGDLCQLIVDYPELKEHAFEPAHALKLVEKANKMIEKEDSTEENLQQTELDVYHAIVSNAAAVGILTMEWLERMNEYHKMSKDKRAVQMYVDFEDIQKSIDGMKHDAYKNAVKLADRIKNIMRTRQVNSYLRAIRNVNISYENRIEVIRSANYTSDDIYEKIVCRRRNAIKGLDSIGSQTVEYDYRSAAKKMLKEVNIDSERLQKARQMVIKFHSKNGYSEMATIELAKKLYKTLKLKKNIVALLEASTYPRGVGRAAMLSLPTAKKIVKLAIQDMNDVKEIIEQDIKEVKKIINQP